MATSVKQAIHENDVVELTRSIDKVEATGQWPAGTRGAVVAEHSEHKLIEISDDANYGGDAGHGLRDRGPAEARHQVQLSSPTGLS